MEWIDPKKEMPEYDKPVTVLLQHYDSLNQTEDIWMHVDATDCDWVTPDGIYELSYEYDVVGWKPLEKEQ